MDGDKIFDIVHAANMRKFPDGVVLRREDGKVLKPDGWVGPTSPHGRGWLVEAMVVATLGGM